MFVRIWDDDPRLASSITVYPVGATRPWSPNVAVGTIGSGFAWRSLAVIGCTREVQRVSVTIPTTVLTPGTYWLEVKFTGTVASGPWVPPVSVLGCRSTGNALQNNAANLDGTWGTTAGSVLNSSSTVVPAGVAIPFRVCGTSVGQDIASAVTFGVGKNCTNGIGAWDLGSPVRTPILGRDYYARLVNGFPNSPPVVLMSPASCTFALPCIGTIYCCPPWIQFVMPPFHATAFDSAMHLPIPNGSDLCGACVCLQAFWFDPLVTCCNYGHSDGLRLCLGN